MDLVYIFENEVTDYPEEVTKFLQDNKCIIASLKGDYLSLTTASKNFARYMERETLHPDAILARVSHIEKTLSGLETNFELYRNLVLQQTFLNIETFSECLEKYETFTSDIRDKLDETKRDFRLTANYELPRSQSLSSVPSISSLEHEMSKLPEISLQLFDGHDRTKFKQFFDLFITLIDSRPNLSDISKLLYLKGALREPALLTIANLSNVGENYQRAKELLCSEYYDEQIQLKLLFKKITDLQQLAKLTPNSLLTALIEIRANLYELQSMGCDLLVENSPADKLYGYLLYESLPSYFKEPFKQTCCKDTLPPLRAILDNFSGLLRNMPDKLSKVRTDESSNRSVGQYSTYTDKTIRPTTASVQATIKQSVPTLRDFTSKPQSDGQKSCMFCANTHYSSMCRRYPDLKSRAVRLKDLGKCTRCARSGHLLQNCTLTTTKYPCTFCGETTHISPLCDKRATLNSQNNTIMAQHVTLNSTDILLPMVTINIHKNGSSKTGIVLIDSGSEKSFLSNVLTFDNMVGARPYRITTLNGQSEMLVKTSHISCSFGHDSHLYNFSFNIARDFTIRTKPNRICDVFDQLKIDNITTALSRSHLANDLTIVGVIGVDLLPLLGTFEVVPYHKAFYYKTSFGAIPFGRTDKFRRPPLKSVRFSPEVNYMPLSDCQGSTSLAELHQPSERTRQLTFTTTPTTDITNTTNKLIPNDPTTAETAAINFCNDCMPSYYVPPSLLDDTPIQQGLEKLFSYETLGIHEDNDISTTDQDVMKSFSQNIHKEKNHYSVILPWKEDILRRVQSHPTIAFSQMNSVHKRLQDQDLLDQYTQIFEDYEANDYIERFQCSPTELHRFIWLPHHAVVKRDSEQKVLKIRPVWNASFKVGTQPSLNQASYAGSNLLTDLTKILCQFRLHKFTVLADIKSAFLNIKLRSEFDRNKLCFMWKQGNQIYYYRFKRIPFGLAVSPFTLNFTLQHHFSSYPDNEIANTLKSSFYVDNLVLSVPSEQQALQLHKEATSILHEGGFELRAWNSNSHLLQDAAKADGNMSTVDTSFEKVLGYHYFPQKDTIQLADFVLDTTADTKRKILSAISSVYDPLGLFSPTTVLSKIFLAKLWANRLSWDTKICSDLKTEWKLLCQQLEQLKTISIPRQYHHDLLSSENFLVIFCDASKHNYGFCAYLCSGERSQLLFSKAKQAPLKTPSSVPKLELMAVVLALKCLPTILSSLKGISLQSLDIFSDSQIALNWIVNYNKEPPQIFIRNRVQQIRSLQRNLEAKYKIPLHYKYIISENNPSDLPTRGLPTATLKKQLTFWLEGPEFLKQKRNEWPKHPLHSVPENLHSSLNAVTADPVSVEPILDITRFSDLNKLIRTTSHIFRFINNCRKITCDSNKASQLYWIRTSQKQQFGEIFEFLQNPKTKACPPNLVNQLNLFIDDCNIIRSKGRIDKSIAASPGIRDPIVLPKNHYFTALFIRQTHEKLFHMGLSTTTNAIRNEGYWIPSIRTTVKSVIKDCFLCTKMNAFSFRYPKFTNMPVPHMNLVTPFKYIGIDFTSHVFIKDSTTNSSYKMYILIYTCLNTRAISLDLLPDMTTTTILLSMKRHVSRFGIPSILFSDNQPSFITAGQCLEQALSSTDYSEYLRRNDIKHIRIPVYSSWVGSHWERLLRIVKQCLYKTVKNRKLTHYEFSTLLYEIADVINSRPLTYRADDHNLIPLTPNSFIKPHNNRDLVLTETRPYTPSNHDELNDSITTLQNLYDDFKNRWYSEYLPSLRETSRDMHQSEWTNRIKIGDVVLIRDPSRVRIFWSLGIITKVHIGDDNKIRSVTLRKSDHSESHHSISNLYPMELSITHSGTKSSEHTENISEDTSSMKRPVRQSALNSEKLWKSKMEDL